MPTMTADPKGYFLRQTDNYGKLLFKKKKIINLFFEKLKPDLLSTMHGFQIIFNPLHL